MSEVEARLRALGLSLPPPLAPPPGVVLPFEFACIRDKRVLISGHGPQNPDGSLAQPLGKVGTERGAHTRSAVGMAELPFDIPVEIEGEVEVGERP